MSALVGRRAADYLAAELRGQLLAREVRLVVEDRMSRGRAEKIIPVRPPRFLGEKLDGLGLVEVPGYPAARFEVYLSGAAGEGPEPRGIAIYSSGTLVAEGFHELAALGLDRAPWTDPRLSGLVDFPGFHVTPGSRRGVVPDEAAGSFARALAGVEPLVSSLLESLDRRKAEELDRTMIRDLQRAFRDFYRHRPRYALLPVSREKDASAGVAAEPSESGAGAEADSDRTEDSEDQPVRTPPADLLPPGPLVAVRLSPPVVRILSWQNENAPMCPIEPSGCPL